MTEQIFSIEQIKTMARRAAETRMTVAGCPFAPGTSAYDHWVTEFHRVEMELRAEVEG
jgi:hypothetical protein